VSARAALLAAVAWLALAVPAAAHVEVLPSSVTQGEATQFTIRVPTERDVPTTQVRVDFPAQVTVFSFADPPPGWTLRPLKAPDGRFRGVVYSGGSIVASRYADFHVLGTAFESGTAVWPSRQRYADGQVKPWTGPPEEPGGAEAPETGPTDPGPAAAVQIAAPGTAAPEAGAATGGGDDDDGSGAGIWLGVIAIGISALAALGVGMLWSTRPARLPGDDEGA
jgi:uncharacterized protein YcnI